MVIGVCDDSKEYLARELALCRSKLSGEHTFYQFHEGKDIFEKQEKIDLLILDIEMPDMNGIELKEKLRLISDKTLIIFVTSHKEYIFEAFDINVLGFVVKENMEKQLPALLDKAVGIIEGYILFEGTIDSRDILYIKAEHNYGKVKLKNGEQIMVRGSMKKFEEELVPYEFLRIHREYLLNIRWIEKIWYTTNKVQISGEMLPLAFREKSKVKRVYQEYCKKCAGCF